MPRARIRLFLAAALVLTNLLILAGPLHASSNAVTGQLAMKARIALSPSAVAVVTLTDRSPNGNGTIIGQQRINGATGNDAFSVPFDPTQINSKHAYSIYASVIDGSNQYQSLVPIAVITGGPTDNVTVPVEQPAFQTPASLSGTLALPAGTVPTTSAVAYAAVIDQTTGRMVVRQVIPTITTQPIPFSVGYDAALVNPDDTYVIIGGLVDGQALWLSSATTIAPGGTYNLTLSKTSQTIPGGGSPLPSASAVASATPVASGSVAPSEQPSNTPKPSKTPKPTESASEVPSATPTQAPTASPTPSPSPTVAPTASPTVVPSASPSVAPSASLVASPSALPSGSPAPITVTGQVTFKEPWQLTQAAVLTITAVQIDPNGPTVNVVGEKEMTNPGQQPISFSLPLDMAVLVPTSDTFLYASIVDGNEAWTTPAEGVRIATNGAPSDNVQVPLTFRPDLIQGEVTGAILDLPSGISSEAWAAVAVLNTDGTVLGFQSGPIVANTNAVPFDVPFQVANVDPAASYVAMARVFDMANTFGNTQGVPVITNNNPIENVNIHTTQLGPTATPTPAPTATAAPTTAPTATPAHSAAPVPTASPSAPSGIGGGIDPLVIAGVIALVLVGIGVVVIVMRR